MKKKMIWILVSTLILGTLAITSGVVLTRTFAASSVERTGSFNSSSINGREISLSEEGCQNVAPRTCSVEEHGRANSFVIDRYFKNSTYSSVDSVYWGSATSNGAGGFCAPASGLTTLTLDNGRGRLYMSVNGNVCEVGKTRSHAAHTFTGTYAILGGTGRFRHASGTGSINANDNGHGASSYQAYGSITLDERDH